MVPGVRISWDSVAGSKRKSLLKADPSHSNNSRWICPRGLLLPGVMDQLFGVAAQENLSRLVPHLCDNLRDPATEPQSSRLGRDDIRDWDIPLPTRPPRSALALSCR